MPKSASLWPDTFKIEEVPQAVKILREQAAALKEITKGILYGDVVKSKMNSPTGITYDFYVCVEGKAYTHKLFSIEHKMLFVYPITIHNYGSETTTQVRDDTDFTKQIERLLNSDTTKQIIGRMLEVAQ